MYHADNPHDSADLDTQTDPQTGRRTTSEVVVERRPIVAGGAREVGDSDRPGMTDERRRVERRRIDRMSTGI